MPEAEFWACTPRYFAARQKAYVENQRREWERARFTGWLSVLPIAIANKKTLLAADLYLFSWEEERTPAAPKEITPEEREALLQFQADAMKIFERQWGVEFTPEQKAANGHYK